MKHFINNAQVPQLRWIFWKERRNGGWPSRLVIAKKSIVELRESKRGSDFQPRVGPARLSEGMRAHPSPPNRLVAQPLSAVATLMGLKSILFQWPRVGRSSQPGARLRKALGMVQAVQNPIALAWCVVLALWFTGCGPRPEISRDPSQSLPTASVRIQTVESQSLKITEEIVGTVRAKVQATLEAKLSGRIDYFPVALGQRVKAGEVLVRLDAAEINARLEQAEASLEQTERDWKRASALFEQQAMTRAEYEAAQSRNRIAKGGAAEAMAMMSYVDIVAPFDGVVTRKWAEVGELAAPGKPLLEIEDSSALQLEVDMPQTIASLVHRDDRLVARVDGVSEELTGLVREIAPGADAITRTFRVKVDLPYQPGLSSGQFARLLVPVGERSSLRVPASSVVSRGQLEIVFVVAKQHAHLHLVKTGKWIGQDREILSGLHVGDVVVIDGAAQLTDGQPVELK